MGEGTGKKKRDRKERHRKRLLRAMVKRERAALALLLAGPSLQAGCGESDLLLTHLQVYAF